MFLFLLLYSRAKVRKNCGLLFPFLKKAFYLNIGADSVSISRKQTTTSLFLFLLHLLPFEAMLKKRFFRGNLT